MEKGSGAKDNHAYVTRDETGFRGRLVENGLLHSGPVFATHDEAWRWALRKRRELEDESAPEPASARPRIGLARLFDAQDLRRLFDPSTPQPRLPAAPAPSSIRLDDGEPSDQGAPRPAIIRLSRPQGHGARTLDSREVVDRGHDTREPHRSAATPATPVDPIHVLDNLVHDFVGTLHGAPHGRPLDDVKSVHAENLQRLLEVTPSNHSQALGPPVLLGASPAIGLESALGLLGSLRKTGVFRVEADGGLFTVSIVNGDVVHGVSYPRPEPELLGNLLVARGAIDAGQLQRFFQQTGASAAKIGEALHRQELVSMGVLQATVEHQLRLLFDRLLATEESVWCLHEGEATLGYANTRLNIVGVLLESARKSDEGQAS